MIEICSGRQGHASYGRIAQGMYRAIEGVMPWLRDLIRVDLGSYPLARG